MSLSTLKPLAQDQSQTQTLFAHWQQQLDANMDNTGVEWLDDLRQRAKGALAESGRLPGRKDEDWKYFSLQQLEALKPELSADESDEVATSQSPQLDQSGGVSISLHAGSSMKLPVGLLQELPKGLRILSLQQALAEPTLSKELEVLAGSLELAGTSHVFEALNTAGMNSALIIHVTENTDAGRLTLDWFQHAAKTARIDNVRVFVFLEAGAQLQLQETFFPSKANSSHESNSTAAVSDSMINQVTQINLADGAALDHLRVQAASESQHLFLFGSVQQASNSEYRYSGFEMGGGLVRNGLISRLEGAGARVDLAAAFIGNGESCIDHHVLADHIATGCSSEQNFRGVLGGRSRGVFNGKAIIRPGADGSSVRQSNANMLLSDLAEMNTKPELEIYADEVEASHGATVGQLDEQALFYMVSRGIAAEDARRMLTGAFCRSIGNRLSDRKLAEQIEVLLDRAMPVVSSSGVAE